MKKNVFVFGFAVFLYASFGVAKLVHETGLQRFGLLSHVVLFVILLAVALFFVPSRLPDDPPRLAALGLTAALCLLTTIFPMPLWAVTRYVSLGVLILVPHLALIASLAAVLMAVTPAEPRPRLKPPQPPAAQSAIMIRIFLGFTLLLTLSVDFVDAFFLAGKWRWISWMPSGFENLVFSAVIVAVFMAVARIYSRIPETRPGQGALTFGVIAYVVVQLVAGALIANLVHTFWPAGGQLLLALLMLVAMAAVPLIALVKAILLVGAYRVLTNLDPKEQRTEMLGRDYSSAARH